MYTGAKTNNKIYVNGVNENLTLTSGTFSSINSNFNSGQGKISGWRYSGQPTTWLMNLNVASFKIYNRELTAQELTNKLNKTTFLS
jgi:hypothetical protein